ncbi:AAA family ATPase [Flavobacterium sp.]|uniref:AAA family ATPase n=1 Tax=Flavobacterium sp. TaxID=239 RepID=UPI002629B84D|nr:AAA family ATPase [Flavobacterium sp.]
MNKLEIELKNCFGINYLKKSFDFSKSNTVVIYASNGIMKTSFANTFQELSKGESPKERLFGKVPFYSIKSDLIDIQAGDILVIKSFDSINSSESQSKLLVDEKSKEEYDEIFRNLVDLKDKIIIDLNRKSGIPKKDIEKTLLDDFNKDNIFDLFIDVYELELVDSYSSLKYNELFNQDVIDFLSKPNVKSKIQEYFDTYNELIKDSSIFKSGVFNPGKAEIVAQTLSKENYFHANHKILFNGDEIPIADDKQLALRLLEEKKVIIENENLLKIENEIKKVAVKQLRDLIERSPLIVSEYNDIKEFKKKIWISYFSNVMFFLTEVVESYNTGSSRLREIEQVAENQETEWDKVREKFNERFFVPFEAIITNKDSSILGKSTPNISFIFKDIDGDEKALNIEELNKEDILSQGEKRAMYLMNVLFNIQAKINENNETLLIIDDIADSFDYKNKYAIIEYLNDIHKNSNFKQIILTHNYDFFRTIQSRLLGEKSKRECSFMAIKSDSKIDLIETGTKNDTNPFNEWKKRLDIPILLIASIPFVRNLIEFKEGNSSSQYKLLTSLLHLKADSDTINISQIKQIYESTINSNGLESYNPSETLKSIMDREIVTLMENPIQNGINLEEKIVISLAIRLKAEKYMISKISDKSEIKGNQTGILFERFKKEFHETKKLEIKKLDRVNLITPENIHINSFMFEPIIDLSLDHLIQLYKDINMFT